MKTVIAGCLCATLASAMLGFMTGCESSSKTSTLSMSPSSFVVLERGDRIIVFSVGTAATTAVATAGAGGTNVMNVAALPALSLPIRWSVSNPELGEIIATDGQRGTYSRTAMTGINIVTARDQSGAEGIATVQQK